MISRRIKKNKSGKYDVDFTPDEVLKEEQRSLNAEFVTLIDEAVLDAGDQTVTVVVYEHTHNPTDGNILISTRVAMRAKETKAGDIISSRWEQARS